jgi:hypothetical protein
MIKILRGSLHMHAGSDSNAVHIKTRTNLMTSFLCVINLIGIDSEVSYREALDDSPLILPGFDLQFILVQKRVTI